MYYQSSKLSNEQLESEDFTWEIAIWKLREWRVAAEKHPVRINDEWFKKYNQITIMDFFCNFRRFKYQPIN
jgi:hypothetical protein